MMKVFFTVCDILRSESGSSFPAHIFPANRFKALDYVFEVSLKCIVSSNGCLIFLCIFLSPFFLFSEKHPCESCYEFVGITSAFSHWYQ